MGESAHMTITAQTVQRSSIETALNTLLTVEDSGPGNRSLREKLLSLERKLASN